MFRTEVGSDKGHDEVSGDLAVPGYGNRGTKGSRGAECAESASGKKGSAGIPDASAHPAVGVSGTSTSDAAVKLQHPARNPRLRDRSPPTIVTRTSSVRAGVGDDGRSIRRVRRTVRKLET